LGRTIPLTLAFDKQYYLGITLQGQQEFAPRTILVTVPYAFNAENAAVAGSLSPNATGAVLSINSLQGNLQLNGSGNITVSQTGNILTIGSTQTGIQNLASTDNSILVTNGSGPNTTLTLATVPLNKLAPSAAAVGDIIRFDGTNWGTSKETLYSAGNGISIQGQAIALSSQNASNGQVLKWNGTAWIPSNDDNTTYTAGEGLLLTGTQLSVLPTGGDLSGLHTNATVTGIQGRNIAQTPPTNGQALLYDQQSNTWIPRLVDPNPNDDITTGTSAGGDLTGTYPNPNVANNAITTSKILDANVTTAKIADAAVTTAKISSTGATPGQALTFDGTNIVWSAPTLSGTAGGDLTGNYPNPTVANNAITTAKILDANVTTPKIADAAVTTPKIADAAVTTAKISSTGATSGQALTFNGTNIVWGAPTLSGTAGGDLTGTYPNPNVANNAITTAKILDANVTTAKIADAAVTTAKISSTGATPGQALTFDGTNIVWSAPTLSGTAGGDLTGTYPNPNVANNAITTAKILDANVTTPKIADAAVTTPKIADAAVTPTKLSSTGATTGQALTFNGTSIVWGAPTLSGTAGGDLTGTYPNPNVANNAITTAKILDVNVTTAKIADAAVTTAKISSTGATTGQALTFNGTNIVWGAPALSGTAGGDLTGTYPNPTVANNAITTSKILDANITTAKIADVNVTTAKIADAAVTTAKISSTGATTGQALTFNGTNIVWGAPALSGAAGGDLTGTYPNPTVANNAITTAKILDANVTTPKIADAAVTTPKLADAAVTPIKLSSTGATAGQALTFNGTNIVWGAPALSGAAGGDLTGTYPNPNVANNAITTNKILDANITTSKILDANVTTPKIADAAVTTSKISSSGATTGQALTFDGTNIVWGAPALSGAAGGDLTGTYPNPNVANNAITTSKILDANVTTPKIADAAVTTPKIADAAVTTPKIADAAVTPIKLSSTGATTGQALTFNGTNIVWGAPALSGTAGGDLTGNYPNPTVANNAITTAKILDANVTTPKIADAAVTTPKIADAAVTPIKLSSTGATTGQALTFNGTNIVWGAPALSGTAGGDLTGTYPNPTVANNAITTAKILDANVTTPKIADAAVTPIKLSSTGATTGQALTFNGTSIVWGAPALSGTAGGDLTGTYPNPTVANNAITTAKILDANVTTAKIADAAVTPIKLSSTGATTGQALTFNGTNIVWGAPALSGAAGGDLTGTYPNPNVANNAITTAKILDANVTTPKIADAAVTPIKLSSTGATTGQALTFNGTNIVWGTPALSGAAGGDLTGTYPNPNVANNAITTAKILDANVTTAKIADAAVTTPKLADAAVTLTKLSATGATSGQALTFNGTSIVWGAPALSGTAGGDLTGTYPNPTVANNAITTAKILDANVTTPKIADAAVTPIKLSSTGATTGQALTFNGTNIVWGAPALSGAAGGDLTGTYPNPTVTNNAITTAKILDANVTTPKIADAAVTPVKLSSAGATTGQALTFNGTNIVWGAPALSGAAGGDLTGTYPNPTVANNAITTAKILDANVTTPKIADAAVTLTKIADAAVTPVKLSSAGATTGQALTFNGTSIVWGAPALSGSAGGDLTGTYPNPTVANNAITTSKILDANVTTPKIADAAVTTPKLADEAVTTAKISSTGATTGQALTFNGTNIVWGAPALSGTAGGDLTGTYPNPNVTNNAITTSKILDANVTTPKIADAAVTTPKLADEAVTPVKLSSTGATTGQALTFNGTNIVWGAPALSGTAGGDLTGTYPNPNVTNNAITTSKILDANVTTPKIADAAVTTPKLADAAVTPVKLSSTGATTGQALTFNGTNIVWGAPALSGTAGGDLTGTYPNPNVANNAITTAKILDANVTTPKIADAAVTPVKLSSAGATTGQALTFDGTSIVWGAPTLSGTAGGDLTGTYPNPNVANNAITTAKILDANVTTAKIADAAVTLTKIADAAVTPVKLSSAGATTGQALTFDGTSIVWGAPTLSGTAGGDLTGTYPNPTVANNAITTPKIADAAVTTPKIVDAAVTASKLNQMGAADGQVLTWNGTTWAPAAAGGNGTVTSVNVSGGTTGLTTSGGPVTSSGTITLAGTLALANGGTGATTAAGARTNLGLGTLATLNTVTSAEITDGTITGADLNQMGAADGQILTWNGTTWAPAAAGGNGTVTSVNVSGGTTGLTTSGGPVTSSGTITLAGTLALANGGTGATTAAGARTNLGLGTLATLNTVTSAEITDGTITGADLNQMGAADGQVLKWNGTAWAPTSDNTGALTHFTESVNNAAPNVTVPVVRLLATNAATNVDVALSPKGTGALTAQVADNGTTGGNKRGQYAVDLQMNRNAATRVANGNNSVISGGENNTASGNHTTIGGGNINTAGGSASTISGGQNNTANGDFSAISGGTDNNASASMTTISGGSSNIASNLLATVSGGGNNTASGFYSTISGGVHNVSSADYTSILGGRGLTLSGSGSVGFLGNNTGSNNMTVSATNTAVFGNVDMWLVNNDNTAHELRMYEASGSGSNYTAFKAGSQAANITYTLPAADGTNGQVLSTNGSGILSWATAGGGGLAHFTESVNNAAPNVTVPVVRLLANNAATNVDIALSPKGTGALTAQVADNAAAGGDKRGTYAVDWQMARANATEVASGIYSTISGGQNNTANNQYSTISGGTNNTASGTYTSIGGGGNNSASDVHSTIGGGFSNTAGGEFSTVSGGNTNTVNANYSSIGGGQNNTASNLHSTIGGGENNNSSGTHSTIAGGQSNTANEQHSTVGGGFSNTASNWYATVAGGNTNVASGNYSSVGGGSTNQASSNYSTVSGGENNTATIDHAFVGGGFQNAAGGVASVVSGGQENTAGGEFSSIAGGRGLTLTAAAARSFGFHANTVANNRNMTISDPNTAVFGNVDVWLASNDNTPKSLRFYEQYNASGAFPSGTNYVGFRAANAIDNDITWTLPAADGTNGQVLSTNGGGTLSWVAGGGLQYFAENRNPGVPNDIVPVHQFIPIGAETDIDIALTPKGTGALTAQVANNLASGGNKRGTYAVDWQMARVNATQVASGIYSTIAGGQNNTASLDHSFVGGGLQNTANGQNAVIGGGEQNTASNGYSTIGGGYINTANGSTSTISGGSNNTASASFSTIGGGDNNTASGAYSVIAGGSQNQVTEFSATVGGGENNTASGIYSTVSGGNNNTASGSQSTIGGGDNNTASGSQSAIPGGAGMTLDANANNSFGFNGNASTGDKDITIDEPNTAVFNNVNLWLANNDNTTRSLRFYEQYNTNGTFPNGANFVGFRAADTMADDVIYTLPAADGTNGQVLSTNGSGILNWTNTLSSTTGAALNVGESGSATGFLAVKSELVGNSQTPADGYGVYRITSAPAGNVTLPGVGSAGKLLYVINASGGNVTINVAGGTFVISNNRASSFISDGTNWFPVQN
jgi:hypothetical protein